MKLAVSNIAWNPSDAAHIVPKLQRHGVSGLVIAPTMVWPEAPNVTSAEALEYRNRVEESGLAISGLQSLVFGRKDVRLFGATDERDRLAELLKRQAELAGKLGAKSLIFGSPGLRANDSIDLRTRHELAADTFRKVAVAAHENGTTLAIEPLSGYGNTYITNTAQGVELVGLVDRPGFGLHLDSAAIAGSGEDAALTIPSAMHRVGITSYDASAPELARPSFDESTPHAVYARILREVGYDGVVSLEMKGPQESDAVFSELDRIRDIYDIQ